MSSFFDKMGKQISKVASTAKEKSIELVEITKLNNQINERENQIEELKLEIGSRIYEAYSSGSSPEDLVLLCQQIDEENKVIEELRQQVESLKGIDRCPRCGEALKDDPLFCPNCGEKLR